MSRLKRCIDCNAILEYCWKINGLVCPKNTCDRFYQLQNFIEIKT